LAEPPDAETLNVVQNELNLGKSTFRGRLRRLMPPPLPPARSKLEKITKLNF